MLVVADDTVLGGETEHELKQKLERLEYEMENRGVQMNRSKTEYMECRGPEEEAASETKVEEARLRH